MNNVSEKNKDSILKSLAVVGFVGIIIMIAWLSVKLVSYVPSAFSSLASIAGSLQEEVKDGEEEDKLESIIVTSNTNLLNNGDEVEIAWNTNKNPGSYTFSYECADGVSISIVSEEGVRNVSCDTNYNIGNVGTLALLAESAKSRYADVNYTISFLATNDTKPRALGHESITVVNTDIQELNPEEETVAEETPETTPEENTTPETETNTPNNETANEPVYEQEFVYSIPTSDPNGRTDLSTKFISAGKIIGNRFVAGPVEKSEGGAIQFEVKNFGSKTSDSWTFTMSLPNGGVYTSNTQLPLKPNERAVLTIGFPATEKNSHTFKVSVEEDTDKTLINNNFSQTVTFVR